MGYAAPSVTGHLSMADVVVRLSQHPSVESVLQIGSLATGALGSASDYDLVIVLGSGPETDPLPPWYVGITQIDHRLTDLIFVAAAEVQRLVTLTAPLSQSDPLAPILRWLQNGVIVHDRVGLANEAQHHLATGKCWIDPIRDQDAYATWFSINYNLAQTKRISRSDDPVYLATAGIRMAVYGHTDLWHGYFTLRKLAWTGDKAAVAYLQREDPAFLEAFHRFVTANSVEDKLLAYEHAARLATSAAGGLWPLDVTVMNIDQALEIWNALVGPGSV